MSALGGVELRSKKMLSGKIRDWIWESVLKRPNGARQLGPLPSDFTVTVACLHKKVENDRGRHTLPIFVEEHPRQGFS